MVTVVMGGIHATIDPISLAKNADVDFVVIGEGERDEAPMLYVGEKLGMGMGFPAIDIAVDPLEGTNLCATGSANAIAVLAASEKGGLLHAPDLDMEKLVVGAAAKPCGACRPVMFEFSDKDTELYLVDLNPTTGRRSVTKTTVYKLLPMAFDPLASGLLPANPRNLLKRKSNTNRRKNNSRPRSRR